MRSKSENDFQSCFHSEMKIDECFYVHGVEYNEFRQRRSQTETLSIKKFKLFSKLSLYFQSILLS